MLAKSTQTDVFGELSGVIRPMKSRDELALIADGQLQRLRPFDLDESTMYRLSIIIPAPGALDAVDSDEPVAFEETLVSVLENRPPHSEVILACESGYSDPYDLGDEVELVTGSSSRWTSLANLALRKSRGKLTNILTPGITVGADWQRDVCDLLSRCTDSVVGASPQIEYESNGTTTAGIKLTPCGRRRYLRAAHVAESADGDDVVFGPCHQAGFFRRDDLLQAGGWNEAIDDEVADIELALRLRSRGFRFAYCENSLVRSQVATGVTGLSTKSSYRTARDLERIYRTYRHLRVVPRRGLTSSLRMLSGFASDSMLGRLAGRFGTLPMESGVLAGLPIGLGSDANHGIQDDDASFSRAA